ncbi:unnamed protein product [Paramecium sonneborni]|uniref:F-box domain-containing protein n=1 Tax=Paramecium sonneborni TaxID=65129 RepID=A0A8S1NP62_9CILI|nr:unnamed protein product [Paramecium sonneborni]
MFQQSHQKPNQQQQNYSQKSQQQHNENRNKQPNQPQNYFWRNIPYSKHQIQSAKQIGQLITEIEKFPIDKLIHKEELEKTCHKFFSEVLSDFDDVTDFEQLKKINEQHFNQIIQKLQIQLSEKPNLIHDFGDKVKMSQLYQVMKIIKSPKRSLYITKDITKEDYFDKIKEKLSLEEVEHLKNFDDQQATLKGQGIFENFKIEPSQVLKTQLNLIRQQGFQNEDHFQSMSFEIYKILAFPYLYLKQCYKYDVEGQSLHFQLPKNISIEVRSYEIEKIALLNQNSMISLIPSSLLMNNILPFLGIIDTFKLRIVCKYLKTIVEKYWYIPHKKEIIKYELAKQLAYNNEAFKNIQIPAQKLKQKLRVCIDMVMNFINWGDLHKQIEANQLDIDVYRPLIMMLRLFNKQKYISKPSEINGLFSIAQLANNIKQQINDYLNLQFIPLSFKQMRQIQQQTLSAPEFTVEGAIHDELSLGELLTFLLQALYFHGWMTQIIAVYKEILKKRQKELQNFDSQQHYNNDFLNQALKYIYKINSFSSNKDNQLKIDIMQISKVLLESLKKINFCSEAIPKTEHTGIIHQNNDVIKIHLDIYFQIELQSYLCSPDEYCFEDEVD